MNLKFKTVALSPSPQPDTGFARIAVENNVFNELGLAIPGLLLSTFDLFLSIKFKSETREETTSANGLSMNGVGGFLSYISLFFMAAFMIYLAKKGIENAATSQRKLEVETRDEPRLLDTPHVLKQDLELRKRENYCLGFLGSTVVTNTVINIIMAAKGYNGVGRLPKAAFVLTCMASSTTGVKMMYDFLRNLRQWQAIKHNVSALEVWKDQDSDSLENSPQRNHASQLTTYEFSQPLEIEAAHPEHGSSTEDIALFGAIQLPHPFKLLPAHFNRQKNVRLLNMASTGISALVQLPFLLAVNKALPITTVATIYPCVNITAALLGIIPTILKAERFELIGKLSPNDLLEHQALDRGDSLFQLFKITSGQQTLPLKLKHTENSRSDMYYLTRLLE